MPVGGIEMEVLVNDLSFHGQFADIASFFDAIDRRFDLITADRSLFKCSKDSRAKLFFPEGLPIPVRLDDAGHREFRGLEGGKPFPAFGALSAPSNLIPFLRQP